MFSDSMPSCLTNSCCTGWRALAQRRRTRSSVSSPERVVRSMQVMARRSQAICQSFFTVRRVVRVCGAALDGAGVDADVFDPVEVQGNAAIGLENLGRPRRGRGWPCGSHRGADGSRARWLSCRVTAMSRVWGLSVMDRVPAGFGAGGLYGRSNEGGRADRGGSLPPAFCVSADSTASLSHLFWGSDGCANRS